MVFKVKRERKELLVRQVLLVTLVRKAQQELLAQLDLKELQVFKELPAPREQRVYKD
jgi:hypothetical protein